MPRHRHVRFTFIAAVASTLIGCASPSVSTLIYPALPVPGEAPARKGFVEVEGARLPYADTGGSGEVVVLNHPATGNMRSWAHQQPALASAGYRVVTWSRRGHAGTESLPGNQAVAAADDLLCLMDHLGIRQAHLVGVAAGGIYATDFALAYPDRARSLTVAASMVAISDAQYMKDSAALRPAGFERLPSEFRELGPQYRASHPEGVKLWLEIESANSISPATAVQQRPPLRSRLTLEALSTLRLPVLLLAGDADLYAPPAMFARMAARIPAARTAVVDGSGHSPHWERPDAFNATLLRFLGPGGADREPSGR